MPVPMAVDDKGANLIFVYGSYFVGRKMWRLTIGRYDHYNQLAWLTHDCPRSPDGHRGHSVRGDHRSYPREKPNGPTTGR